MLKTASRIAALFAAAVVMSLSWSQSGQTASTCTVERGIDPLDVLNQTQTIRHNVWIALDTSGSMMACFDPSDTSSSPCGDAPSTPTRIAGARDAIIDLLDTLVDSSGEPLVNWGFTYFDHTFNARGGIKEADPNYVNPFILEWKCPTAASISHPEGEPPHDNDGDGYPEEPSWCKGMNANSLDPPLCSEPDPRPAIEAEVNGLLDSDGMLLDNSTATPDGVLLDELSEAVRNFTAANPLLPGQKNYIILLTDGEDTCECYNYMYDNPLINTKSDADAGNKRIRGAFGSSAPSHAFSTNDSDPQHKNLGNDHERFVSGYNAGLKGREAFRRVDDSDQDGVTGDGDIFVVGMGLDTARVRITNHLAWESSGVYYGRPGRPAYDVSDPTELADALEDIFQQLPVPPVTVGAGSSVVGSVKEVIASHTNTTHGYTGADFLAAGVGDTEVRKLRGMHRNNVLFTTSFELPGFRGHLKAYNIYNVQSDESRTADFTEIWDAGEELQTRNLSTDPRRIYFNRADGTSGQLSTAIGTAPTLTATDLGVSAGFLDDLDPLGVGAETAADAAKIVEMVLQGWRLVIDPTYGFYDAGGELNFSQFESDGFTKTWKLLDATNSAPAVVLNPPRSPDADPPTPAFEYSDFYGDNINRMTTVSLGTNGGMMHAFRADNGYEIYGYIPHDLLPELKNLARTLVSGNNGVVGHNYYIAASATVQDAYLQDSPNGVPEWRTVLTFGRGAGGKYVTALDVTDVGDWDGDDDFAVPSGFQAPDLVFTVGNRDGFSDPDGSGILGHNYDGFGETWSLPMIGRVHNGSAEGQWVLFMGTGYGCVGTDEGRYLYVLKLEDGTVYKKLGPIADVVDGAGGDAGIDQNGTPATPSLFNPHEPGVNDGRDFVTRVYIGDLQGVIHKLDATDDDPDNWEFGVFFEVTSEADDAPGQGNYDQPITVMIEALKLVGSDTIYLFVGTGGDNRIDLTDPDTFKIAGIVDTDNSGTVAVTDPAFQGDLAALDGGGVFFFDLPEGERMTVAPVLARNTATNGVVFFATVREEIDPDTCTATFFSTLFAAGVTTGLGSFDLDPSTAGLQDQTDLGEGKVTSLFHRDEHLYVSKSGGINADAETQVLGSDEFPAPGIAAGTIQILVDGFRMSPF